MNCHNNGQSMLASRGGSAAVYASDKYCCWTVPTAPDSAITMMSFASNPPAFPPPPLAIPERLAPCGEFDSAYDCSVFGGVGCMSSATGSSSSYGSPSCSSTQTQAWPGLMQRSVSSHSLQKNEIHHHALWPPWELLDSEGCGGAVRRVFSTGDLEGTNMAQHSPRSGSSLSNETTIFESMNKASRYSPEEKKERIERYRSKRNQRNFNKTIKYACRKTLADSRPRIRGRFARNDEIEKSPHSQDDPYEWVHGISGGEEDDEDTNWINLFEGFPTNLI